MPLVGFIIKPLFPLRMLSIKAFVTCCTAHRNCCTNVYLSKVLASVQHPSSLERIKEVKFWISLQPHLTIHNFNLLFILRYGNQIK